MVGILVLTVAVMLVLLRHTPFPSITLGDGREFSFAGMTVGAERFLFLEPTSFDWFFWKPICSFFPNSQTFFRSLGVNPPWIPGRGLMRVRKKDVIFWISTRSINGVGASVSHSLSADGLATVGDITVSIRDSESKELLKPIRVGAYEVDFDHNLSFSFIQVMGLQNESTTVVMALSRENNQGHPEELATWEIEIP